MKIGFTGTRKGLTQEQKLKLIYLQNKRSPIEFHHGDCIGADYDSDLIIRKINKTKLNIIIHPPNISTKRKYCSSQFIREPKPYLERNKDIVNETDLLIACPKSDKEELRSGTWATIRYARKVGKKIIIILPNGKLSNGDNIKLV